MNDRLHWYNDEKTIAIIEQNQEPSWAHWHETTQIIIDVLEASPHRVHFILTNATGIPVGNPLPHLTRTLDMMEAYVDKLGMMVIVGKGALHTLMTAFLDIALKATNRPAHSMMFAHTIEEALERISQRETQQ